MFQSRRTTSAVLRFALGVLTIAAVLTIPALPARPADPGKKGDNKAKDVPFAVTLQAVFLAPKESRRLQMTTKKPMRSILNDNDQVLNIQAVLMDPTTVLLNARKPGLARVTLADPDGKQEGFLVLVAVAPQPGAMASRVVPRGPEGPFLSVLVASEDIAAGTVIRRPSDFFKRVHYIKEGHEPKDAVQDFEQLKGKRLKRALAEDQPVKWKDLTD